MVLGVRERRVAPSLGMCGSPIPGDRKAGRGLLPCGGVRRTQRLSTRNASMQTASELSAGALRPRFGNHMVLLRPG